MTKNVITINADNINALFDKLKERDVEIKGASLKDALCSFSYELLTGPTKGDTLNHKGKHIIHDDLQLAFTELNVFIAHLDDAYTGNDNGTTVEQLREEVETGKYFVDGFEITGVEENRAVVLSGFKYVSAGAVSFKTPKVKFNGSYLYLHQLRKALYDAIEEVDQYRNGKTAPQVDPDQGLINFPASDSNDEFANAAVTVGDKTEE